ncbi:MAG: hypothetical protein AAF721_08510, partial [Myxococcota bacterium]
PDVERTVFVDAPAEVRADKEAHYKEFTEHWRELQTLTAAANAERGEGVGGETIAALEDLRRGYVVACGGDAECMHDGLPAAVAHQLFLAHVSRRDTAAAMVEMDLVEPTGPRGRPTALQIHRVQQEVLGRARVSKAKALDAKRRGLDAQTAAAALGEVAVHDFTEANAWPMHEVKRLEYAAVVPGTARKASGKVKAKKKAGDGLTQIVFADVVKRYADEDCRDTNKVERIGSDGRVQYKQRCRRTGKTIVHRRTFDPVVVPTPEAAGLKPGDKVALWTVPGETKTGRVRWAHRKDRLVMIRDVPVRAPKPGA